MSPGLKKAMVRAGLPFIIIIAGFCIMQLLIVMRRAPEKFPPASRGILVDVEVVSPVNCPVTIQGTGTVRPRRMVDIVPEVSGKVISISSRFVQGGMFRKGEELFRIEPVDYELKLEKARAVLAKAKVDLAIEKTRGSIAAQEWRNLEAKPSASEPPLVLRKPQLSEMRAAFAAARASVSQAKIDLERTKICAPFNAIVKNEKVDEGQYVRQGVKVGELMGTNMAEIVVPVSLEDLEWIKIPGLSGDGNGSRVVVSVNARIRVYKWNGRVVRLLGDVDSRSRMSRVVVDVENPFQCEGEPAGCNVRLADGLFVDVRFHCGMLHGVYEIKRDALHQGDTVWIMDDAGRLRIRKMHVIHYEGLKAVIDRGLSPEDRIVLTSIPGAVDGLMLRVAEKGEDK